MKFVSDHLTWHHATHAPHRFMAAVLLSPIHAAEQHYERRYRLNYVHAKKLFVFDTLLVIITFLLIFGIVSWRFYRPSTTDLVELQITTTANSRLKSGTHVTLEARVHNRHEYTLQAATLTLDLPAGFILDNGAASSIPIGTIRAGETKTWSITGYFYATPGSESRVLAHLVYEPLIRETQEEKIAPLILRPVESVLTASLTTENAFIPNSPSPAVIQIANTGDVPLSITIPLFPESDLEISNVITTTGTTTADVWAIPELAAHTTTSLFFEITVPESPASTLALRTNATVLIYNRAIPQVELQQDATIVHPDIIANIAWDKTSPIAPGTDRSFTINVVNNGDESLQQLTLTIPLASALVDTNRMRALFGTNYTDDTLTLTSSTIPGLATLLPNRTVQTTISIPLRAIPVGTEHLTFTPTVRLQATTPLVPNTRITQVVRGDALPITSVLTLSPEIRYFTAEGDQLGRGPLPPQVGKTTKYLAIITLGNTTNEVANIAVEARLAPGIIWTGKKSVSAGKDITYAESTRTLSWNIVNLAPHEQAVASMEIALTPDESERGTSPMMIERVSVSGRDEFTGQMIGATSAAMNTTIPADTIGHARGGAVQ